MFIFVLQQLKFHILQNSLSSVCEVKKISPLIVNIQSDVYLKGLVRPLDYPRQTILKQKINYTKLIFLNEK